MKYNNEHNQSGQNEYYDIDTGEVKEFAHELDYYICRHNPMECHERLFEDLKITDEEHKEEISELKNYYHERSATYLFILSVIFASVSAFCFWCV